jgi:hypothetical protein
VQLEANPGAGVSARIAGKFGFRKSATKNLGESSRAREDNGIGYRGRRFPKTEGRKIKRNSDLETRLASAVRAHSGFRVAARMTMEFRFRNKSATKNFDDSRARVRVMKSVNAPLF